MRDRLSIMFWFRLPSPLSSSVVIKPLSLSIWSRGIVVERDSAARLRLAGYDAVKKEFAGVRLTSPGKLLYPEPGISKLELAAYYREVADWILPHAVDRPLTLVRCPEGRHQDCFYQKHPGPGTPATLRQIPVRE